MELKGLRHQFIQYLKRNYDYARPEIMASNVFYAWHNDIGMEFWNIFESDETMQQAKMLLVEKFLKIGRKNPKGHAEVYYGCWKKFRDFLSVTKVDNIEGTVIEDEISIVEKSLTDYFDLLSILDILQIKRRLFHSEADFQFALAWEIQTQYPEAEIRLEYSPKFAPNMHIDILVHMNGRGYPIELKYITLKLDAEVDGEHYNLKSHGAQDIRRYDCLYDLHRLEQLKAELPDLGTGYALWLTNDSYYWRPAMRDQTVGGAFCIHEGCSFTGSMSWASHTGIGTMKGRETPIQIDSSYTVHWRDYNRIPDHKNGIFRYACLAVENSQGE